jgi:predicted component of type VI protein secretion system
VGAPPQGDEEEDAATRVSPRALNIPRRALELVFDTGERVLVQGGGLIGRDPAAREESGLAHLIAIQDPDRSVSKTHVEFGLTDGALWVKDHGSTNGSTLTRPGGTPFDLKPGQQMGVDVGDVVTFGERRFQVTEKAAP